MLERPRVSPNGRRLCFADGRPFFWLGDTAWELFHRLTRSEAEEYLKARAGQGFNVIQAVALAELDGLRVPNRNGDLPLINNDPTKLNEPYWRHVDEVIDLAGSLGLYIGLLPTWGDKVNLAWGPGPVIFDEENALTYGRLVGRRYASRDNIIWINGGDRDPQDKKPVWRALAKGLKEGDDSHERLMTFHPQGGRSSAEDFHEDPWLDFNMMQTGHGKPSPGDVAKKTRESFDRRPVKPVLDGEPRYENHPIGFNKRNGYFDDADVRQAAYESVFAGGCGVTYGCHAVWQFASDRHEPVNNPISHWRYSLTLPGASQMRHLKELMLGNEFLELLPDSNADGRLSNKDGSVVLTYSADGKPVETPAGNYDASWFDPTTGKMSPAVGPKPFVPPKREEPAQDWVLVLRR